MAEFIFDTQDITSEESALLSAALSPLTEADTPLTVELICVSEEEIRRLNSTFRATDSVTDVLSFPAMDGIFQKPLKRAEHPDCYDGQSLFLGSVVLCESRVKEQAEEYGHSYKREFFYLTVHGVLHCLGYDHMTDEDKRIMREREEEVMARMHLNVQ